MKSEESSRFFPEELKTQLFHLIVSNAVGDEQYSGVLPMTREAIICNHLIRLDMQANAVERIISADKLDNSKWTKYNNLLKRFIYDTMLSEQGEVAD